MTTSSRITSQPATNGCGRSAGGDAMSRWKWMRAVDGYVYCSKLGQIHEDTLNPYEYPAPDEGEEDSRCRKSDHVKVYARQEPSE